MKIGLMGFEFCSPNKGCEALTYSILSILSELESINNNLTIYNFSGTGLGSIPKFFKKINFIEIPPKLKDIKFKFIRAILKCDVILDVTMGDSFSDIYSEDYFKSLMKHKKIIELLNKKYILLPQTYGPFNSKSSEKIARKVLKKASKIYCRDRLSQELLENKFNIRDSILTSDLAFILPFNKMRKLENNKIKIGINISGLLYKGGFINDNQFGLKINYKEYIERLINYYGKKENYEIHLIPHVIDESENSYDDDYKVCKSIQIKHPECILAPAFINPIEAKSYISNMNYFIGSRMHSTIAAFSSGVVTIPVSYSRKFEGLFNSLNYSYVINAKIEDTDSAYLKTIKYLDNSKKLEISQIKSLKLIEDKKKIFIESLESEING